MSTTTSTTTTTKPQPRVLQGTYRCGPVLGPVRLENGMLHMGGEWAAVHLRLVAVTRLEARAEREGVYLFMAAVFFLVLIGLLVADIVFGFPIPYRGWVYAVTALFMVGFALAYWLLTYGVLRIYDGNGYPLDIFGSKKGVEDLDHTLSSFLAGLGSRTP